jgi:hypothetical protein
MFQKTPFLPAKAGIQNKTKNRSSCVLCVVAGRRMNGHLGKANLGWSGLASTGEVLSFACPKERTQSAAEGNLKAALCASRDYF